MVVMIVAMMAAMAMMMVMAMVMVKVKVKEILTEARVDWQLPTLFVTEVALSYLSGEKCEKVLRLCATFDGSSTGSNNKVVNRAIVSYEAMRLNDEFGRRM